MSISSDGSLMTIAEQAGWQPRRRDVPTQHTVPSTSHIEGTHHRSEKHAWPGLGLQ